MKKALPVATKKKGPKMKTAKTCGTCEQSYTHRPFIAVKQGDMFWWNCKCGSTMAYWPAGEKL